MASNAASRALVTAQMEMQFFSFVQFDRPMAIAIVALACAARLQTAFSTSLTSEDIASYSGPPCPPACLPACQPACVSGGATITLTASDKVIATTNDAFIGLTLDCESYLTCGTVLSR